ncbi:uncharacterized protein MJAP1_000082 [Malassezia japonica]|uniref:SWIM-type domain-containing protein n=1 Tax=Malassezia japonica TaxID=223818 RepID=A0AAF0J8I1_9BASI|nr:uncharacterized protein MJAP1_000082 [Malassezia japonica]WFD37140.1 hypothetical protein MJAP1_000082 [Malassezia japonica]
MANGAPIDAVTGAVRTGPLGEECTIYPAILIEPGEKYRASESVVVQRYSAHYACSCPAWRFHAEKDVRLRSCEHLAEVLGEAYEAARMELGEMRVIGRQDHRVHLLLASTWPTRSDGAPRRTGDALDPTDWWISEKLDGVRALWDGQRLWSRRGKEWNAPRWFLEQLPRDLTLDGELWMGRGLFEHTSGVCRSHRQDEWEHVKYMVFDTPSFPDDPVEARWARLQAQFPAVSSDAMSTLRSSGVYFVEHVQCAGQEHLETLLEHALACDGEGLMLRRPTSLYEYKRSTSLYKLKPTLDAEARVLGYEDGQNQIVGLVGSLICETLSDPPRRFKVGSGLTDALRRDPPAIGTLINFQYGGIGSQGVPRFPRYRGVVVDR